MHEASKPGLIARSLRALTPERALDAFIASNLAFLGLDIALAHAANDFARREEWWPLVFSLCAALLLLPRVFWPARHVGWRGVELAVGAVSVAIGVLGMMLHLKSAFFEQQTLATLVYSAPFAAPLAYVGLGLLLIMTCMQAPGSDAWASWVLLFTLGGFVGNFALTLADHAQNGFFARSEWLGVGGSAYASSFLLLLLFTQANSALDRATHYVLWLQAALGAAGFVLHVMANLARPGSWLDRALYGAPLFAPLLFVDLALLGAIALWARALRTAERTTAVRNARG